MVQIATFGTFQSRSAWRDLARIHEVDIQLINKVAAFIYSGMTLKEIYNQNQELREFFLNYPKLETIYQEAMKLKDYLVILLSTQRELLLAIMT